MRGNKSYSNEDLVSPGKDLKYEVGNNFYICRDNPLKKNECLSGQVVAITNNENEYKVLK